MNAKTSKIVKGQRSGYLIDDGSGFSIRYATKRLAEQAIAERIRWEAAEVQINAERKALRLSAALAYLAQRAERVAYKANQLNFAF